MIAVDTSAIISIAFNEPERAEFLQYIFASKRALISAPTLVEIRVVVRARANEQASNFVDEFLSSAIFEIIPVDKAIADLATRAYVNFGKGTGHPAQLNFGDVFSYALAKSKDIPLLFKGNDFAQTDVRRRDLEH
jgi:ribonuclease VapC